ncbi:MAG TPA: malto-oligosyltrehalose trehalohydrolase [Polyangiaceae bacterium]
MSDVEPRLGAFPGDGGTLFCLWSTRAHEASVRLYDENGRALRTESLERQQNGVFCRLVPGVGPGALYKYLLDGDEVGDPAARFLPQGVFGPARVEATGEPFGPPFQHERFPDVIYELHVGTFTAEGTYRAALARLPELAELGVDAIELMPLAAFPGQRGWGYDGVAHYAPFAPYGTPAELRELIARAHELGLGVLLDVVYNHFGPAGNWLPRYADEFFRTDVQTPWGPALNYKNPVLRRYVLDNARYWFEEFGFDGLRLDATHAIFDDSPRHILEELSALAAEQRPRRFLIAEDERNQASLVKRTGLDAIWADDFHHALRVTLTGESDGYYAAYPPGAATIADTLRRGWHYDGRVYPPSGELRGTPAHELEFRNFVYCIQNHDQIGNRALGTRLNHEVSLDAYCAASVLFAFLPTTLLLFMGQEWAASAPFLFFTDHDPELGELIRRGRREEFKHFAAFSSQKAREQIPDPQAVQTFEQSRLDWNERRAPRCQRVLDLYRDLFALRKRDAVLSRPCARDELEVELAGESLLLGRGHGAEGRLLIINFGERVLRLPDDLPRVVVKSAAPDVTALAKYAALVLAGPREALSALTARLAS